MRRIEEAFMKAFVVLSGQTDFDAEGRIIGNSDPPLNDTGRSQAIEISKSLQSRGIDMILSAPHIRTMETAEIIADELGFDRNKITKGLKLVERDFGDFNGKLKSEVDMFVLGSFFGNAATPNGETIKDTAGRIIDYMNNMVKIFRAKTMLLIVPEHVLDVMFWFYTGLPKPGKEQKIEKNPLTVYEFDTDDIPPEIKDYQAIANIPEPSSSDNDPGRLLTQSEIDALIAEITGRSV